MKNASSSIAPVRATPPMSGDHAFVKTVLVWRRAGHGVTLITVTQTWGSSPRPAGSLMAVRDDGVTLGSISGGCLEEDLLLRLRNHEVALARPTRLAYGTTRAEAARMGLPCGGRMEVVVEGLRGDDFAAIDDALGARRPCLRRLNLASGEVDLREGTDTRDLDFRCDDLFLERRFGPAWRLLLIGANDLARHLVHCASHLDYEIVICDPRADQRNAWDRDGVVIDARMPDEAVADLGMDRRTAVVTLTHDPRIDDLALMEALASDAFYVGALGSQRTSQRRRERLRELGLSRQAVGRLHAPVGIAIGSRTPAEIAISILAQITAERRRASLSLASHGGCAA